MKFLNRMDECRHFSRKSNKIIRAMNK